MTSNLISPFAKADPTLPIRKGSRQIVRATKKEVQAFPAEAKELLDNNWATQKQLIKSGQYDLKWLEGRHILLAGATGLGLGCALATAAMGINNAASITVLSRDLKQSLNFATGKAMQAKAEAENLSCPFHWINEGMSLEGKALRKILATLKEIGADRVVYFNTVAAAISGLLPGFPPVFTKEVDENGLFQWQLTPMTEQEIHITKFVMGDMAVQFPKVLEENGIEVELSVFADWRGSIDKVSRNPATREYGRHSSYSTSLYLPKEVLQANTRDAYGTDRRVIDIFYPMMRTRALPFIPGGMTSVDIQDVMKKKEGIHSAGVPELALGGLNLVGKVLTEGYDNPFPRLDNHDAHLDEWQFEILVRLNNDENSDFYYKRWMP